MAAQSAVAGREVSRKVSDRMNVQTHNGTASPRTGQLNPWLSPEEVVKQPQDNLIRMAVLGQGLPYHYTPQRPWR
ncbi:unnamed protein product [Gadus morhua 'NCC']